MESDDNTGNMNKPIFKKAVVAAGFSPRLSAVLNEACRLVSLLETRPVIVHVGEDTPAVRNKLEEAIACSNFKDDSPEYYIRNGSPAEVLISAARELEADLIIAGALKKEGFIKYYIGSVARTIARHAPCSVLLMTEPHIQPQPFNKIHCAVEYEPVAELAVKVAVNIAREVKIRDLFFTHTFQEPELGEKKVVNSNIQAIKEIYKREDTRLKQYLSRFDFKGLVYNARCLFERSQSVTLDFTREIGADLFIVHGSGSQHSLWERLFPQHLELALQNLPCSILMTRENIT